MPDAEEYLVKLGVNVDENGINKVVSALKSTNLSALAAKAALVGLGTAIYKFVEQQTSVELSYKQLAVQQKKSIANIRAEQNALKAMGTTLAEVKKDNSLKAIYNDIVKTNKEIGSPDTTKSLQTIRSLQGAWWGLKSSLQYALQWINAHVLANLEGPIKRLTGFLTDIRTKINQNMNLLTGKVASWLTAFSKGLIGIVETGKKIISFFKNLSPAIQGVATTVLTLWAALKSGPIGQLLGIVTALGGLIDDYNNYQTNAENKEKYLAGGGSEDKWNEYKSNYDEWYTGKNAKGEAISDDRKKELETWLKNSDLANQYVTTSMDSIWDTILGDGSDSEKATNIAQKLATTIFKAIGQALDLVLSWLNGDKNVVSDFFAQIGEDGTKLGSIIKDGSDILKGIIQGIANAFNDPDVQGLWAGVQEKFGTLFSNIWNGKTDAGGLHKGGIMGLLFGDEAAEVNQDTDEVTVSRTGGIINKIGDKLLELWETVKTGVTNLLDTIWTPIQDLLTQIGTYFTNTVLPPIAKALYNAIYGLLPDGVAKYLGMKSPSQVAGDLDTNTANSTAATDSVYFDESGNPITANQYRGMTDDQRSGYHEAASDSELAIQSRVQQGFQDGSLTFANLFGNGPVLSNAGGDYFSGLSAYLSGTPTSYAENLLETPDNVTMNPQQAQMFLASGADIQAGTTYTDTSGNAIVNAAGTVNVYGATPQQAYGGRIASEGTYTVGEDGTEYIIPITKPSRAAELIRAMFAEMGTAGNTILNTLGIGTGTDTIGGSVGAVGNALQGMNITNNYTISAPVNITVTASGTDGESIGRSVYSSAERYLVRTLQGVYA